MKTKTSPKQVIKENKPTLKEKFKVETIGIFGSYVKGEENKDSDVDLLVEFSEPINFFTFLDLEEYLENQLNRDVDLVTKEALKKHIGKRILNEVSYL